MLRRNVGDSTFKKIIQTYYATFKGINADSKDFENTAEKVSGKDLTGFFDQWLYRPGIPKLKFTQKTEGDDLVFMVEQQQPGEPYELDLDLFIETKKGSSTVSIVSIETKKSEHRWKGLGKMGATIAIDPKWTLLFEEIK